MESSLIDFLNHGILPFVGRSGESDRIIDFWHGNGDVHQLRAMLILGEAGIGKSRLVEEIIPRISQAGGAIVHVKFYPESTTSIAALLVRALRFLHTRRGLLLDEPDDNLLSVIAALRRIARLRPTLLVLEDIHLLNGEAIQEFAVLLEAVSDEHLSVLCLSRPSELTARAILERYLVTEIELKGLDREELESIWEQLFGLRPGAEIVSQIRNSTLGNPLALRSALRGAIKAGALVHDVVSNAWRPTISAAQFGDVLQHNVHLLSAGLAAHLSPAAKEAARRLAWLGEVFSEEAAHLMLDDAQALIAALSFRGIIASLNAQVAPLPGSASPELPLAFTHTILHDYLAREGYPDTLRLLRVIALDLPLYSVLPFQMLAGLTTRTNASKEEVLRAIRRSLAVALQLDDSPDWQLATFPLQAADAMRTVYDDLWEAEERAQLEAELLAARLALLRRAEDHEEYAALVDRFMELTEEPTSATMREHRLTAFTYRHSLGRRIDPRLCADTWERSRKLIERYPELRRTMPYLRYLDSAARSMLYMGETRTLREIETELMTLAAAQNVDEEYRQAARYKAAIHFLDTFDTEEELRQRLDLLAELETTADKPTMSFLIFKIGFLAEIGRMDDALATIEESLPLFREQGLTNNYFYGSLYRICARAALGEELPTIEAEALRLCAEAPRDIAPRFRMFAEMTLIEIGLLRGDNVWLRRAIASYRENIVHLRPEAQALLQLEEGVAMDTIAAGAYLASREFRPLLDLFLSEATPDIPAAHTVAVAALQAPILRLSGILEKRAVLAIITELGTRIDSKAFVISLGDQITGTVGAMLRWLGERELTAYMTPIIDRFKSYLSRKELSAYRTRIERIDRERYELALRRECRPENCIFLSMLGTVEIGKPQEEKITVRGSRLRALLGLMVADRMLDDPLAYREFCYVVTGIEDDPERARRTLNGIVYRLREMIGHDSIVTDAETPRLNMERVHVDLLDAFENIRAAEAALNEESLTGAQSAMLKALNTTAGEVPFPGLYETFFEAVRDDLENQQRQLVLQISNGLLAEQDPRSAEELLRAAYRAMPNNVEIADLLCHALTLLGKRAEAERVRIQNSVTA